MFYHRFRVIGILIVFNKCDSCIHMTNLRQTFFMISTGLFYLFVIKQLNTTWDSFFIKKTHLHYRTIIISSFSERTFQMFLKVKQVNQHGTHKIKLQHPNSWFFFIVRTTVYIQMWPHYLEERRIWENVGTDDDLLE